MQRHSIPVSYRLSGMRLDAAISDFVSGISRRRAKAIVDMGGVYVNKKRVRIASRIVSKGDRIDVEYNETLFIKEPSTLTISKDSILYCNHEVIVINKPAGVPSQATRDQSILHVIPLLQKTLALMEMPAADLQLVHRLDKDTTGALILATSKSKMTSLTDQFRSHTIEKYYHAVVWGRVEKPFEVNCNLSAIQANSGRVKVLKTGGKSSRTFFEPLLWDEQGRFTLLLCKPITGRSHQLRVHLDHVGFPIVGDKVYGEERQGNLPDDLSSIVKHQLLHARTITFSGTAESDRITVEAQYPDTFSSFLERASITLQPS